jgi:hypothetical protein
VHWFGQRLPPDPAPAYRTNAAIIESATQFDLGTSPNR